MQTRTANLLLAALLVGGTLALYARVGRFDFINYDDPAYTYENPHVLGGLSWTGFRWSLTTSTMGHW